MGSVGYCHHRRKASFLWVDDGFIFSVDFIAFHCGSFGVSGGTWMDLEVRSFLGANFMEEARRGEGMTEQTGGIQWGALQELAKIRDVP